MGVQALGQELAVEQRTERIVRRLPGPREVELQAVHMSQQFKSLLMCACTKDKACLVSASAR